MCGFHCSVFSSSVDCYEDEVATCSHLIQLPDTTIFFMYSIFSLDNYRFDFPSILVFDPVGRCTGFVRDAIFTS
jgi:hypothetical protein